MDIKHEIYKVACHTDNVGPGTIFVAINGTKENGAKYIPLAIFKGAKKIVIQTGTVLPDNILLQIKTNNIELEFVDNSRKALAQISAQEYNFPAKKLKIVGITGTKGKTTTTFLIEHILRSCGFKTALASSVKNFILTQEEKANFATPLPDYLQHFMSKCVGLGVDYLVIEVAAQALSCHRIEGLEFETAVFTNFSQEHAEFYSSMDEYFKAKLSIINNLKPGAKLVINSDDNKFQEIKNNYNNCISFSLNQEPQSNFIAKIIKSELSGLEFEVKYSSDINTRRQPCEALAKHGDERHQVGLIKKTCITSPLVGQFNVQNILAATAACLSLDLEIDKIIESIKTFSRVPGRLEKIILSNGAIAFVDYAHNAASFQAVLSALRPFSKHLIVLFGAGGDRDPSRRPVMGKIASEIADVVILSTDNPRSENPENITNQIQAGISEHNLKKVYKELDREKAIKLAYSMSNANSTILLLGKGVSEYQIVGNQTYFFSESQILRSL